MKERALAYLQTALGTPQANFHAGQWESIAALLDGKRVLVVQRTGWGKSMVYFLATKLLREQGKGLTLLVSPLLSLMRNQIEAAARIGVRARKIDSTNRESWDAIAEELRKNTVDILLISPERLANDDFRTKILASIAQSTGMLVIDEAHCISDWGHDFRPDYRRIINVLKIMPPTLPVLATTATANNRVVADIQAQMGGDIEIQRGPLVRKSLRLQNITMPNPAERMAWLAHTIPQLSGSGIVYTLTQRDAALLTTWLTHNGIKAKTYHAGLHDSDGTSREQLEQELLCNSVKVLVATVALGMGFDKPDLGFVIHYQRPASVVHYYQQVGRAGRAVDEAAGILLCGEEDDHIADFFIRAAFPPRANIAALLTALMRAEEGLSINQLQNALNLTKSQLEATLKFLSVESPSPVVKIDSTWNATAEAASYTIDQQAIDDITRIRQAEQQQMRDYMTHEGCLMAFLQTALDDPHGSDCGKCQYCAPEHTMSITSSPDRINQAGLFLRRNHQTLEPRKQWPAGAPFTAYTFTGGNISQTLRAEEGRALCLWRDAGWGQMVRDGKYAEGRFCDALVDACADMVKAWNPQPLPKWICCVPSLQHPELLPDFAQRLAQKLDIPFVNKITKVRHNAPQKEMHNSFQQARNLDGVFALGIPPKGYAPCLLVDDMVDSRWTFTILAALLRQVGCAAVYPLALALNSPRMD